MPLSRNSSIRCGASAMSLKRLKDIASPLSVRLTLWYTFLFTVGTLLLFGLCYLQFHSGYLTLVRSIIKEQVETKAAVYRQGGPAALLRLMDREDEQRRNSY